MRCVACRARGRATSPPRASCFAPSAARAPGTRCCALPASSSSATPSRLCLQAGLWGKARSFLEASLSFDDARAVHLELARLAERLGDTGEAQRHFRRAAELP